MMSRIQCMNTLALELLESVAAKAEILHQAIPSALGFPSLDVTRLDFKPGDLVFIETKTADLKTSMIIKSVLQDEGHSKLPRLFFGNGETVNDLTALFVSAVGQIDQAALRTGILKNSDWPRLTEAIERLRHMPIHIFNGGIIPLQKVKSTADGLSRKVGHIGLIVVDACCISGWEDKKVLGSHLLNLDNLRFFRDLATLRKCAVVLVSGPTRNEKSKTNHRHTTDFCMETIDPTISIQVFDNSLLE